MAHVICSKQNSEIIFNNKNTKDVKELKQFKNKIVRYPLNLSEDYE